MGIGICWEMGYGAYPCDGIGIYAVYQLWPDRINPASKIGMRGIRNFKENVIKM